MQHAVTLVALLALSCRCMPPPDKPDAAPIPTSAPAPYGDASAATTDAGLDDCGRAEARIGPRALHPAPDGLECRKPDGTPWWTTPGGTPFAVACRAAAADGRNWEPRCIATIHDCADLDRAYSGELCK